MSFTEAIKTCLSKYVTFSGRARRSEYWWFILFAVLGAALFSLLDTVLFGASQPSASTGNGPLTSVFNLAILLPVLAAAWRRLHDTGRPGWYILIPMMVSAAFLGAMFLGVMTFGVIERAGVDSDTLRGGASAFGITGLIIAGIVQLVVSVLMLYWLTRPSQPEANEYGPVPA